MMTQEQIEQRIKELEDEANVMYRFMKSIYGDAELSEKVKKHCAIIGARVEELNLVLGKTLPF